MIWRMLVSEIKYNIEKCIGIIGEGTKGWKKEVNIISWNDRNPKLDIRDWDENHTKMGKGVTLSREEAIALKELMMEADLEDLGF
jgi:hypothetical protein